MGGSGNVFVFLRSQIIDAGEVSTSRRTGCDIGRELRFRFAVWTVESNGGGELYAGQFKGIFALSTSCAPGLGPDISDATFQLLDKHSLRIHSMPRVRSPSSSLRDPRPAPCSSQHQAEHLPLWARGRGATDMSHV